MKTSYNKFLYKRLFRYVILIITLLICQSLKAKDYVVISEIMYDSPLNEQIATGAAYSNGEYIELYNAGYEPANLSGWSLKGGGSTEIYNFPSSTVIPPQGYLLIVYQYSNSGFTLDQLYNGFVISNDHQIQYQKKIILSNSGEPVTLYNASGVIKDYIYIDGTSNKTKPNRLSAENADGTAGNVCVSLQRKAITFDSNGNAVSNNTDWLTSTVTLFNQNTVYVTPTIPEVTPVSLSPTQNYIVSVTPLDATSQVDINNTQITLHGDNNPRGIISIQYLDGLGRSIETVQRAITPNKKDLVTYVEYDDVGREWKHYLQKSNDGKAGFIDFETFKNISEPNYNGDANPFTENVYEPSPLNRITEQFGAGQDWKNNNKRVITEYQSNSDDVLYFYVSGGQLTKGNNYASNTLYKTTIKDEDGKASSEYKDKLGRVVLKQNFDAGEQVNTYYVYNDLGQLSYVIPPKAVDELTLDLSDNSIVLKQLCYLYKYDDRGNCIYKRLPGCEPIYMVYDKADRLILSQDGNQRQKTPVQWTVTKYDVFGRVVYTGTMESTTSQTTFASALKDVVVTETLDGSAGFGYTMQSYGVFTSIKPLTVNYYDNSKYMTKI